MVALGVGVAVGVGRVGDGVWVVVRGVAVAGCVGLEVGWLSVG